MNPRHPIYVISKGRWESRLTAKALEMMKVPYQIVIEPQELEQYSKVIDPAKILVLPFSNLGQGSIPARNFVWEHSLGRSTHHWILDDNIDGFGRLTGNMKIHVDSGTILRAAEDFVDRYENIGMAGFEYDYFLPRKVKVDPYRLNTRVYSNILIKNDLPFRWRGKYNEDTDLSLRVLKAGYCTVLFQAFIAYKVPTLMMKGGNTDTVYATGDKRREFAESLKAQHPDVTEVVWRYGRWHHDVDYRRFSYNKLIRRSDVEIPTEDQYPMEIKNVNNFI